VSLNPPTDVGGPSAEFGDYSSIEIKSLRAALAKIQFPAPEGSVGRLLVRTPRRRPVEYWDWLEDTEKKGRIGGNIVEYWLNAHSVLKVATAYYSNGENLVSKEEWAVVLSRAEWETFSRPIYPNALEVLMQSQQNKRQKGR